MATTTIYALQNRIVSLIEALTPALHVTPKFRHALDEDGADFRTWATAQKAAALRRFQVRADGADQSPAVSDTMVENRMVIFETVIAYPQTLRAGKLGARDRDRMMVLDQHAIENAIGLRGYGNFTSSNPNASFVADGSSTTREEGDGVDFLVIVQAMRYFLAV
jgi:hypothetical protein